MLYEKGREFAQASLERWRSEEVFSTGWFIIVFVLIAVYTAWIILGDRHKAAHMLLIGSLAAVAYTLNSIVLGEMLGKVEYNIRLLPISPAIFMSSITLSPIIIMLSEQYSTSWKGYLLRSAIGFAFKNFVVFTLFTAAQILVWHDWNVFFHFLVLYGLSIGVRFVFLLILGVEKRHTQHSD